MKPSPEITVPSELGLRPWANEETLLQKHLLFSMLPQYFPVCPAMETLFWKEDMTAGKKKVSH